jgi:hypothetical protein
MHFLIAMETLGGIETNRIKDSEKLVRELNEVFNAFTLENDYLTVIFQTH